MMHISIQSIACIVYAGSILTVYNLRPYARGDLPGSLIVAARRNFNSRPCTRGDYTGMMTGEMLKLFQFTPLHEGRPTCCWQTQDHTPYFNSRPCTRGDSGQRGVSVELDISIHAPARGATAEACIVRVSICNFNSRPCTRGDFIAVPTGLLDVISIHAPARGATKKSIFAQRPNKFQFTPLHEGRPRSPGSEATSRNFNSRPCTRGDGKRYAFSANLLFNPHKSTHSNSGVMYFAGIVFGNISQNHCMNFSITLRELSS